MESTNSDKEKTISLTDRQLTRYACQIALPGMSDYAQEQLLKSKVVVIGMAGLGPVVALNLLEVGIGCLVLVDTEPKLLDVASKELRGRDPDGNTTVELKLAEFKATNAEELIGKADVIIDGLDNWQAKLLLSDVCMHLGKPLVHAGVIGFWFQVFTMIPKKSACLRCVFPQVGIDDVPLSPPQSGRCVPVIGMAGALQALEAIKLIAHLGAAQGNELFKFDCLTGEFETITALNKRPDCPDCGRLFRNRR